MKHFDIDGVSNNVELGKRGPHVKADADAVAVTKIDGSLTVLRAAPGANQDDVVTVPQLALIANQMVALTNSLNIQVSSNAAAMASLSGEISSLQAMVVKLMPVAPDSYAVGPNLASGTLLGSLKENARVTSISVEVTEAFDGDVSLLIGDGANLDYYMDGDHSDLAYVGTYTMTPPDGTPDSMITASMVGTATKGSGTIRISYS